MSAPRRSDKETVIDLFNARLDDRIEKRQNEKELVQIIQRKNTQIQILNQVNTRLGAQLSILQKKLGIDHDVILKELQEMREISVAFHYETQQLEYLDVLLTAYDETIMKQRKIISHLYSSLEDCEKKTQNLVKDNQFLLLEVQQKTKQILQIYSKGFVDDNLVSSYNKLQRETEIEQIENMREQNDYLLRHYRDEEAKCSKLEQQLAQVRRKSDYHYQNYKKQSEELKSAVMKVDDLLKIKEVLEKKFDQVTQENIQLQSAREHLESKVNRLQVDYKTIRNQLYQQRTNNRQQIEKISDQLDSLKIESEASEKRERQYFNKNMLLEKDIQTLRDENRALKRETEKIKTQFEQTLKMCETYDERIKNYARKQAIINETMQDNKEKLDNALLERDKAQLKEKQLQKLIENINNRNRDEMDTLKNTFEKIINEQNEKIRFLEDDKEDLASNFHQSQVSLKHQVEKLKKQNSMLREENQKNLQSVRNHSGNQIIMKLKDLEEKNQTLARNLAQKERVHREDVDHKDQLIRNLENQNRDIVRQVDRQRNTARQALNQRTQLKSKISVLQREKQCLEEEVTKLKRNIDMRATSQNEERGLRIRQLQEKLSEAMRKEKDTRQKAIELLQKYDSTEQQLKLEYENKINTLETELMKLRKKLNKK